MLRGGRASSYVLSYVFKITYSVEISSIEKIKRTQSSSAFG